VDAFLEELIDRYDLASYQLVGFTSMFSQNAACFAMARKLKQRNPRIITVIGGANCEASMGRVIARQVEAVDFVFSGAALKSFPEFVRCLIDGDEAGCHRITGVYSRQKLAEPAAGQRHEIGEELDVNVEVPLDYEDFFASLYEKVGPGASGQVIFETSRGCWWGERAHCTFCGLNGMTMKYRAMEPAKALQLIRQLLDQYGDRVSRFQCIDNIMPREYLTDVFPHLRPPGHVSIFYEVKADLKDREMEVLAQAGVTEIQPGIEALATSTLRLMRKGTTAFQNLRFLKSCLTYGIQPHWNLLIGFPGEEEGVYRKYFDDLPLLVHLPPPTGTYPVRFDRFSPYHVQAKEYGLNLKPCEFYSMIYPFDEESLDDLAYFFIDQQYSALYFTQTAEWIARLRQRIEYWRTRWEGADGAIRPQLFLDTSGRTPVVYDSRTGQEIEHVIGETGMRILALLGRQMRLSGLVEQLGDLSLPEVGREIEALSERGLLFREDDLCMSLVAEGQAPATLPELAQGDAVEQFNFA
jgi:magnesium-protoporphyrin IX monomethyl ester (oxidative) cyclase